MHGPADPTLGLSVKAVASGLGVTRSTIYRHWSTIEALNHQAAALLVCSYPGWQRRFIDQPVQAGISAAIEGAIGRLGREMGGIVRSAASCWPAAGESRIAMAEWEEAWLHQAAAWFDAHLAATGRTYVDGADGRLAATALIALVEGRLTWMYVWEGADFEAWPHAGVEILARQAASLLGELTEASPSSTPEARAAAARWSPDALPEPPRSDAVEPLLDRFEHDFADGRRARDWLLRLDPGRLVDIGRLARRLDVSERRLYAVWPSPAAMNEDILAAVFDRQRTAIEAVTHHAIDLGTSDDYPSFDRLFTSWLQAAVFDGARPDQANYYVGTLLITHEKVRQRIVEELRPWRDSIRTALLALLSISGWHRRPATSADEYADTVIATIMGLHRLARLHPELLTETRPMLADTHPVCGLIPYLIARSLSTPDRPEPRWCGQLPTAPPVDRSRDDPPESW